MCAMAVASTAMCVCSFGTVPVPLNATSSPTVLMEGKPAATIMDKNPMVNIPIFGMCSAPPSIAAPPPGAPSPCTAPLVAPWMPGQPKVLIKGKPALTNNCKLMCPLGGVISITMPGTTHTQC